MHKNNESIPLHLNDFKEMLESKFQELSGISKSTISRCLKSKLNMSYQKFSKIALKAWKQENMRKMLESATLLYRLNQNNTELIFVDEFSFQPRGICIHGWAKRNSKPIMKSLLEPVSYSFIVSLSHRGYYVYSTTRSSINSTCFQEYLWKLLDDVNNHQIQNNKKYYIVTDNSSIHKTKEINKILEEKRIGLITISPYSPWLNPIEAYINAIKSKFKQKLKHQQ